MGKYVIDETTLTGIGDAIREKEGTTEVIPVNNMKARIQAIDTQEDLDAELATQDNLIAQIMTELEGKAAAASVEVPTCSISMPNGNGYTIGYIGFVDNNVSYVSIDINKSGTQYFDNVVCGGFVYVQAPSEFKINTETTLLQRYKGAFDYVGQVSEQAGASEVLSVATTGAW